MIPEPTTDTPIPPGLIKRYDHLCRTWPIRFAWRRLSQDLPFFDRFPVSEREIIFRKTKEAMRNPIVQRAAVGLMQAVKIPFSADALWCTTAQLALTNSMSVYGHNFFRGPITNWWRQK